MSNNNNKIRYQFTRHIQSCNNIFSAPWKLTEPSATQYGILHTTEFAKNNKNETRFTSKRVFVSNLLRTWITAFILYGINFKNKNKNNDSTLELYVAPYLKEKKASPLGFKIEKGNYPEDINKTLNKFYIFLEKYFKITNENINNFPDKIILSIPAFPENNNRQKFTFYKKLNKYIFSCQLYNKIEDTIGPKCRDTRFLDDGDLQEFIKWHSSKNFKNNNIVHVVTHSQIMFSHVKSHNININKNYFNQFKEQNCWSFLTDKDGNPEKFLEGVPEKPISYKFKSPSNLQSNALQQKLSLCIKNSKTINNKCNKN